MIKDSTTQLVAALRDASASEELVALAEAREFSDYQNTRFAFPKMELVKRLKREGLDKLAMRVVHGEFDDAL